jgi:hypothetical protein
MPEDTFCLVPDEVKTLRHAFDRACAELGIGMQTEDVVMRDRLANVIVRLFRDGERDAGVLHRRAVLYVRNAGSTPGSSSETAAPSARRA